jgi:hypothetical protein
MMFAYFAWKQSQASQNLTLATGFITWLCSVLLWSQLVGIAAAVAMGCSLLFLLAWFYHHINSENKPQH